MKPWRAMAVAMIWAAPWKIAAQEPGLRIVTSPRIGDRITASVGDVVWTMQTSALETVGAHVVLDMPAREAGAFPVSGTADLPAGSLLNEAPAKTGLRACARVREGSERPQSCLIDINADGTFDLFSYYDTGRLAPLKSPASYHWENDEIRSGGGLSQITVSYLGVSEGSLSLSYREIYRDAGQPAYTETVSIPVMQKFPQNVHFKRVALQIIGMVGDGIRYSVVSAPTSEASP